MLNPPVIMPVSPKSLVVEKHSSKTLLQSSWSKFPTITIFSQTKEFLKSPCMSHKDYVKFQVEDSLFELENCTSKIKLKSKTYDCWFLLDLYTTFKQKKPGCNITLSEFMTSLQENNRYTLVNHNHISQYIVFIKNSYDKDIVDAILESKNPNQNNKRKEQNEKETGQKKLRDRYEDLSDDDSDNLDNIKVIVKNEHKNKNKKDYKNTTYKKQKVESSSKNNTNKLKTYDDYRTHMLDALEFSSVFLITTFNQAMINKHGICFDYKKAKANRAKYARGKLSVYLDDCNDIFSRIDISNMTYYKRRDTKAQFLIDRRKSTHLKKYFEEKKNNKYSLEIMIVNMFPVKTTAKINEIEKIFELVYNVSILSLIAENSFEGFLCNCKSPNMILKDSKQNAKVTLIPTHISDYKTYDDVVTHEKAIGQEDLIINRLTTVKYPEIIKPVKNIAFNYEIPVKSCNIYETKDHGIISLLHKADLNIPTFIQESDDTHSCKVLFEKCSGSPYGLKSEFFYLIQNINFEDDYHDG